MPMAGPRPDIDPRGKYSETQAARLLGVNRSTLYRWKRLGYIKPRPQRHNGWPRYLGRDLLTLFEADMR